MIRRIDAALHRAGLSPLQRPAWIEVDIDTLTANARTLTDLAAPAALGVVVKADGYGHGLEMAARCAIAGGATWLCVADAGEALRLRDDGYEGRVFVLYPVPEAILPTLATNEIDVTVGSMAQVGEMTSNDAELEISTHVEIDTGMTRGGVSPADAVAAARMLEDGHSTRLGGVWTHLAAPEDPEVTKTQLDRFAETLETLSRAGVDVVATHAVATGGFLSSDPSRHTFTRVGLGFYGNDPDVGTPLPHGIRPALAVRAHAVRLAEVSSGTSVGYAGTWTTDRTSLIATLPIGYADGWSRSSSPGSDVLVNGVRAPVVGRVSSDSLTVDVTDVPDVDLTSEFTLMGAVADDEIDADEIAAIRGTISWEVLQQLGSRLSRVYLSGTDVVASRAESTVEIVVAGDVPGYEPVVTDSRDT